MLIINNTINSKNIDKIKSHIFRVIHQCPMTLNITMSPMTGSLMNELMMEFFESYMYAVFGNAFLYTFVEGTVLSPKTIFNVWGELAISVAQFHSMPTPRFKELEVDRPFICWSIQELLIALSECDTSDMQPPMMSVELYRKEFAWLWSVIESLGVPMTVCHNDLCPENLILKDTTPVQLATVGKELRFLDFEFTGINYFMYDIACLFCTCCVEDVTDFGTYPSLTSQKEWVDEYFSAIRIGTNIKDFYIDLNVSPNFVMENMTPFMMMSHLFWTLWATVQHYQSDIDYDFKNFRSLTVNNILKLRNPMITSNA
ncbi:hypothetical protein MXB_5318 [Myxobolus squamalis]|nr:hypothetical protein MXB_5318 [Myxobolus squamalis]